MVDSFRTFVPRLHSKFLESEILEDADDSSRANTYEGLEKFITTKVYGTIFCVRKADGQKDKVLIKIF